MKENQGKLVQSLTLSAAIILVISSVIGSGVYKKVAPMTASLQSPLLVLLAWLLAGLISMFGALSNAEIAGMMASSGGEYYYFKKIYGKFTAFIYGWSTFITIKTASVASIAYVFAHSFNAIMPLPSFDIATEQITLLGIFKPFEDFGVKMVAIVLIIILTYVNTRGLKNGALLSSWITKLVIGGLACIVISGLIFGKGSFTNIFTNSTSYIDKGWGDFAFIQALFASMLAAFWAYEGWNTVGFIGAEIKNPNKNLPIALFTGMTAIIIIYLIVNFTYLYVLPADEMIQVSKTGTQIAAVAVIGHFAGSIGISLLSFVILITTLGCTNSTIIMPPRIYNAMALDGLFFKKASNIHPKYNTPNDALWMQCIWAIMLVLSGSFDQLTDMLIFAAFFFYGITALGVFILRKREPDAPRPYKVWGYPIIPAFFILFCIALIIITIIGKPREAGLGLALMVFGIPFYLYWNRKIVEK